MSLYETHHPIITFTSDYHYGEETQVPWVPTVEEAVDEYRCHPWTARLEDGDVNGYLEPLSAQEGEGFFSTRWPAHIQEHRIWKETMRRGKRLAAVHTFVKHGITKF